ncbi:MAG: single-strand DNA-binding protein, partial [Nonlabens sp.]
VIVWRGLAEQAKRFFKKGTLVYIEGKLAHRNRQDKEGSTRKITEVVANTIRLLEKREYPNGANGKGNVSPPVVPAADDGSPF